MRNGQVSFWWQARGIPPRRPSLPGGTEADVCIVGAGYTGLWTAYYLKRADPGLRIVVLEASFAGFGASGRNGGWVTAALPGSRARYARHPQGRDGVRELERHLRDTVDEVARVCAAEGIDAGLVKGGTLTVATSAAQDARLRDRLEQERSWGDDAQVVRYLERQELAGRLQLTGAVGALFSPDCARVQPAELVAGLAEAVTRAGVRLYEATPVTSISAGQARTPAGTVRAPYILRCTEGFTADVPGQAPGWTTTARSRRRPSRSSAGSCAGCSPPRPRRASSTRGAGCSGCPGTGARPSPWTRRPASAGRGATRATGWPPRTWPAARSPTWCAASPAR